LRLAIFLAVAGFIVIGPVAEQIFGLRMALLRSWTMFSAIGLGVIDARFELRQADGALAPLDRFELLKASHNGKLKRIETREELAAIVKRLCEAAGQGADIRVHARQATREGWRPLHAGETNACRD
jgi:hypothetical protein